MRDKLEGLWRQYRTWRIRRRWSQLTPWGQVEAMLTAVERDPQLRKRFRRALGIRADGSECEGRYGSERDPAPRSFVGRAK